MIEACWKQPTCKAGQVQRLSHTHRRVSESVGECVPPGIQLSQRGLGGASAVIGNFSFHFVFHC